jgi:hypothetical protein
MVFEVRSDLRLLACSLRSLEWISGVPGAPAVWFSRGIYCLKY